MVLMLRNYIILIILYACSFCVCSSQETTKIRGEIPTNNYKDGLSLDVVPLLPETLIEGSGHYSGVTTVRFTLKTPDNTPPDSKIYLSGTFDEWSGGSLEKYQFSKVSSNNYSLTLQESAGTLMQFKVARGSWESGEVDERGRRIGNRVLFIRDNPIEIELIVDNWNDKTNEMENADAGFWETPTPLYDEESGPSMLSLVGNKTVVVSSLDKYKGLGARAKSRSGVDLSNNIKISQIKPIDGTKDYIVTYRLVSSSDRVLVRPVSRLIRIKANSPTLYTLRPVGSTSSHLGYAEQLPSDYGIDPSKKYPLFIYHHGARGEASSINLSPMSTLSKTFNAWDGGPARIAIRGHWNPDSPLIVLSPQRSYFEADMSRIDAFVDFAIQNYQVDPNRVYMGGFSAGGFISWEYAIKFPHKVAAILPLSGGVFKHSVSDICNAKDVSVWAFHSVIDRVVNVNDTKKAVELFNECKPRQPAKLTLFDNIGHSSHQQVLELQGMQHYLESADPFDINLYSWLLSQKIRKDP
jgi:predicted esterase